MINLTDIPPLDDIKKSGLNTSLPGKTVIPLCPLVYPDNDTLEARVDIAGVQKMAYWSEEVDYWNTTHIPQLHAGLSVFWPRSEANGTINKCRLTIFHNWIPIFDKFVPIDEFIKTPSDTITFWFEWAYLLNRGFAKSNFVKTENLKMSPYQQGVATRQSRKGSGSWLSRVFKR